MDSHQFWFLLGLLLLLAILFAGFSLAFLWFRPQVRINNLPDDILLLIFARLPVSDLLTASLACHRWHVLLPTATHARRDLFLKDLASGSLFNRLRAYYPCPIASGPSAESALLYENATDEHRRNSHLNALLRIHLTPNQSSSLPQRSYHLASLAPHLPGLFPNINRLTIAIAGSTETLNHTLDLLTTWAPTLTTLYLSFREMEETSAAPFPREDIRRLYSQLQVIINSMSNLKHLHFSVSLASSSSSFRAGPITLHLPIIAQLETFYCYTCNLINLGDVDLPLTELQTQLELALAESSSLKEVAPYNWSTLGQLQLTSPSLAKAFVRLAIYDIINETNLPIFANLSTQWPNLRSLTIKTSLPLSRFLPLLRSLHRLVHLMVYLHSQADERPTGEFPVQLESIKYLRLYHQLTSHRSLLEHVRTLRRYLPCLKVASLVNQSYQCTDCGYDRNRGDNFNADLAAKCDEHSVTYLKQVFPRLDTILRPIRFNWREWKQGQTIRIIGLLEILSFIGRKLYKLRKIK